MRRYNPKEIEPKWQEIWDKAQIYKAKEDKSKPPTSPSSSLKLRRSGRLRGTGKKYILEYFPYPSGATMHVGHVRNYTIGDAVSRFSRMQGNNVLHPMGWDAFGLPAENYAIKNNISPRVSTDQNIKTFKRQLIQMGFSYDWSRELDSSNPDYYRWTQWLFLLFYKKGLAYRAKSLQNWCPKDQTVLANEQVVVKNGVNVCERDDTPVVQKEVEQWFLKITDYADRLVNDLDNLDWPESIKAMQRNWIGRSEGALIKFEVDGYSKLIEVFTTAYDTIFGTTFMVLAPEHPLVFQITTPQHQKEVNNYIEATKNKTELDRLEEGKNKTGLFTGAYAINPINKEKIPIWVADYVLMSYGTGAIMAVPGEDERDHEFAQKFKLPIVYTTEEQEFVSYQDIKANRKKYKLAKSDEFNGLDFESGQKKILEKLVKLGIAKARVQYRLRDWSVSRQRYWGCPIPIIYCDKDGIVPVPEEDLPVLLPENVKFRPTGQSPLKDIPDFVNVKCPKCGGPAERETDTFDTFIDSSWYFLRFTDPHNDKEPFVKGKVDYWMPVDNYIGGAEHAVVHLLYARFWTKFLYDNGLVGVDEPFKALRNHGMIGGADGRKMGKRYGNVVTPDELIKQGYGADSVRLYELFIGPYDQGVDWNPRGIAGTYRFLDRVWVLIQEFREAERRSKAHPSTTLGASNSELESQISWITHKTIKKVTNDLKELGFNTAISALMEAVNGLYKLKSELNFGLAHETWQTSLENLVQLLAPLAPHIAEELWSELGHETSVHLSPWPKWDEKLVTEDVMIIVIQINGKLRAKIGVPVDLSKDEIIKFAKSHEVVAEYLKGKKIKKEIYVPGRLISFVVD